MVTNTGGMQTTPILFIDNNEEAVCSTVNTGCQRGRGGGSKNPVSQTLVPAHLQHHKELLLTPEGGGGRKEERKVQNSGSNNTSQIIQCSSMKQEMTEQVSRRERAPERCTKNTHTPPCMKQTISVNSWRKLSMTSRNIKLRPRIRKRS